MYRRKRLLSEVVAVLGLMLPNIAIADIDTTADAFGDFGFRANEPVMFAQSFIAFSSHIGGVTLIHDTGPVSFYLHVTGARADATTTEGFSPDFSDILYSSPLVTVSHELGFVPIPISVDADMTPGDRIFIVGDAFSADSSGGTTIKFSNLTSGNTIDGSLLWVAQGDIPSGASALTDFNVDGAFTDLGLDLAVRITVPESGLVQMQAVALLAIAALSALRIRTRFGPC